MARGLNRLVAVSLSLCDVATCRGSRPLAGVGRLEFSLWLPGSSQAVPCELHGVLASQSVFEIALGCLTCAESRMGGCVLTVVTGNCNTVPFPKAWRLRARSLSFLPPWPRLPSVSANTFLSPCCVTRQPFRSPWEMYSRLGHLLLRDADWQASSALNPAGVLVMHSPQILT